MAQMVQQVPLALREQTAKLVLQAPQVLLALLVQLVQLVRQVPRALRVLLLRSLTHILQRQGKQLLLVLIQTH
jgi:hypothetical protein